MEEGFYHENPSIADSKNFPIGTTNPGIQPNHNPTMLPSLRLPTLSSSNTSNYISITLNRYILHASFTKLSILKIGDNPYINLSPSPYTSVQTPGLQYFLYILGLPTGMVQCLPLTKSKPQPFLAFLLPQCHEYYKPPSLVPLMVGLLWLSC